MPVTLTKEIVIKKYKIEKLEELKNLNLWGNDIEDVEVIKELPNLEVIGLSVNKIKTLKYFSYCPYLSELYLRKNCIEDIEEINHLKDCKLLKILWLEENPICNYPNYREYIINLLPQLIKLDNISISDSERETNKPDVNKSTANKIKENRSISPFEPRGKIKNNTTYPGKEMISSTPNINDYKRLNRSKMSIDNNMHSNMNDSKMGFTFAQKNEKLPKPVIPINHHSTKDTYIPQTDYMNEFKNLNELTSYFANPHHNMIPSSNRNKRNESESLKIRTNKIIQNFDNYHVVPDESKINTYSSSFNNPLNLQSIPNFDSNQTNHSTISKANKPKSNLHLIKAIFNLLEELDKSDLIYLRDLIDSNLTTDNNTV